MAIYYNNQFRNYFLGSTGSLGKMYYGSTEINPGQPLVPPATFISATGGTVTTDGDYKIHTFSTTGTSSFVVSSISNTPAYNLVEYLIVAGGGSGGRGTAGGGGAGGVLTGSYSITAQTYNAIVGNGAPRCYNKYKWY